MRILVVYASQYGSTREIAERIAARLVAEGEQAAVVEAKHAGEIDGYDAFVIGSAAYMGSWLKDATEFVRRNAGALAGRPVWLFSSGPLGTQQVDDQGRDVREASVPKEIAELRQAVDARDHHVFFGALDSSKFNLAHRLIHALPASKKLFIEGDFRDWEEIDAWAVAIARSLRLQPAHV